MEETISSVREVSHHEGRGPEKNGGCRLGSEGGELGMCRMAGVEEEELAPEVALFGAAGAGISNDGGWKKPLGRNDSLATRTMRPFWVW